MPDQIAGHIPLSAPGVGAALYSAISSAVTGGDLADVLSAAAISFVAAQAHNAIGEQFDHQADFLSGNHATKTIAHGLVGGTASVARGGKFSSGLLGASMGEFAAPLIRGMPGGVPAQTIAASMVGGGAAELGGGKFADGATSGAFVYLYNETGDLYSTDWSKERLENASGEGLYILDGLVALASLPFQGLRAAGYGLKALATWGRSGLVNGTDDAIRALPPPEIVKHHVFNVFRGNSSQSQKYRDFFKNHGIDVNQHTVELSVNEHRAVHAAGNNWTTQWKQWIDANPNATTIEVYQQAGRMMDLHGINNRPIIPY